MFKIKDDSGGSLTLTIALVAVKIYQAYVMSLQLVLHSYVRSSAVQLNTFMISDMVVRYIEPEVWALSNAPPLPVRQTLCIIVSCRNMVFLNLICCELFHYESILHFSKSIFRFFSYLKQLVYTYCASSYHPYNSQCL